MLKTTTTGRRIELYGQVGAVAELLIATPRRSYRLSSLRYWVIPAAELGQLLVFYDSCNGSPVAYVSWAFLSRDVAKQFAADGLHSLHVSEWNEGLELWLIDFVAPYGHAKEVARYLRDHMFERHERAWGLRRNGDDSIRHIGCFRRRGPGVRPAQ